MSQQTISATFEPEPGGQARRESILAAVSFAAEQFLQSDSWEQPINSVLAKLGQAVEAHRVYIFENFIGENDMMTAKIHSEWVSPGTTPQIDSPLLQDFSYEERGFSRWLAEMGQGQPIFGHVANFPPEEQAVFNPQSIISLLTVPVFAGTEWWGFIGFDDCLTARNWAAAEIESLRAAANIIGVAIQRVRAETVLRQSEAMNRTLLESLPDALFRVSADGRFLDTHGRDTIVNYLRRRRSLGLTLEEIVPLLPSPIQEIAPRFLQTIEQVQTTGEPAQFEYKLTIDGRLKNYEARIMPSHGNEVLVLVRDITDRKRSEEMLIEAQKAASVRTLAGGIAHDFNNLLTSLMAQASVAQIKIPAESPARPHLEKILAITQRAADLTYQLLTYAGKAQARVETLDLNKLIAQNVNLLETMLPQQKLNLNLSDKPMMVWGDRGQLQQVIMNLIINAAEAIDGENSQVVIKTEMVTLEAPAAGDIRPQRFYGGVMPAPGFYVCLQVTDDGVGMDEATISHIFDPFFSTKMYGRGLGLSAILGIVNGHQGALQVDSELGKGTKFTVWLPISAEAQIEQEEQPLQSTTRVTGMILLVDDEAPVREAVVDILQTLGLKTITAANGQEGLALFDQHHEEIAVVLLDMQMPIMGGKETLEAIRQRNQTIPVILSSGYSEAELSGQLTDEATSFLQKPYNMDRLIEVITAAIKQ
jgi:two-component system, cell cycle sensor histidine kinase and response regulator CckA